MEQALNPQAPKTLPSGELEIVVTRNGEPKVCKADLLELKLTCEQAESQCGLRADSENRLNATPEFIRLLAGQFESCGIEGCTPTEAWSLWITISEEMSKLKNSLSGTPN